MRLIDMTWEDARDYLASHDALLLPAGMCEQHSTHLPLGTDTMTAEHVAHRVAEETGFLVAPTLNYGIGLPCDRVFPGSTSLTASDLQGSLRSIVRWWTAQGFRRVLVLSAHGDPFHLQALRDAHEAVRVLELYDIELADILERQSGARHADEAETSVMLHLFPERVRLDRIRDFETPFEEFEPYLSHRLTGPIPGSPGCQGYPSAATAEKGRRIVARMIARAVGWTRKVATAG
ncbi:MAG: creatininase family protein [Candidatus Eisenbacteria bacterium]|nr:creatininase family protein [Candidatus Eisenbacteria bacterium]